MSDAPSCLLATSVKVPSSHGRYVRLNVGGHLFYTTLDTLTKHEGSMLKAMFSGRMEVLMDSEGWVLIDRCGKHFATVLNYLRDNTTPLPSSERDLEEVLAEAKFYLLDDFAKVIQRKLLVLRDPYPPLTYVPVLTAPGQLQKILDLTRKPLIRLMYNRGNNKYSYTSNSDENLLRNMELFDRLSVKFATRITFVKDIAGTEICCWSFYGLCKKVAEICCESIVYATEKKQTKIEYPEAKIFEEALNVLLYEDRSPDGDRAAALYAANAQSLATIATVPPTVKTTARRFPDDDDNMLY